MTLRSSCQIHASLTPDQRLQSMGLLRVNAAACKPDLMAERIMTMMRGCSFRSFLFLSLRDAGMLE